MTVGRQTAVDMGSDWRDSPEAFRLFVESVQDYAIYLLDPNGYVATWNVGGQRLNQYTADEIIGQHFSCFYSPEDVAAGRPEAELSAALDQGRVEGQGARRRNDGSIFQAHWVISALKDGQGAHIGFGEVTRDITAQEDAKVHFIEQRALELALEKANALREELTRSNRDLEQFAYVASHDLQEPLRGIVGCVQILKKRYANQLDGGAEELIAHTVSGASRMQALIEGLLQYSRVGTKGKPFSAVDCNELMAQARENLSTAIAEAEAEISSDLLPVVQGDGSQLGQLFQNLIANAIKYRGDNSPRIHISARRDKDEWLIGVQDNGIGVSPEYADRIFLIFQRLHARHEYPGIGLGLAICKRIVERHGGRIWVDSIPGQGSLFSFTLPAVGENE